MNIRKEILGWAGMKLNGVSFNIDIVNACVLKCPSCAVGSIGKRNAEYMSIDLFRRILDKAEDECRVRKVQFYAYSEACIHPDLHEFVQETTDREIPSYLSTMLQATRCDFEKLIEARPTEFRISFPGWDKMAYYQRGARPELFNEKIERVCALPRYPETTWTLAFHLYRDNADELPRVRALAEEKSLKLVVLPAIFMVLEKTVEKNYSPSDMELISHLLETPEQSMARMKPEPDYCLQWKQITLDAEANVYLCQLVYEDRFKMMNFLDAPLKKIQKAIKTHSFCGKCMAVGAHSYQKCYQDFTLPGDPVAHADKERRKDKDYTPMFNLR